MEYFCNTIQQGQNAIKESQGAGDIFVCTEEVFEWFCQQPLKHNSPRRSEVFWHKYPDEMPDVEGMYLVYGDLGICTMKWYGMDNPDRPRENTGWKLPYPVTHWSDMPNPPIL